MATRDKHRKRSHVSYAGEAANYRHWLATRPYKAPVGFERMMKSLNSVLAEAVEEKDEVSNS